MIPAGSGSMQPAPPTRPPAYQYEGALTVQTPGTYSYTYRFSDDFGYNFIYGDFDPGTANGFSVNDLGTLTVY